MTEEKDITKTNLKEMSELVYQQIKRAYQLGYSDGVEDALNGIREEKERKKLLSQPWQA